MSWRSTQVSDERMAFIVDWLSEAYTVAELCRRYDVSRKTGYKLIARFEEEGVAGLLDRSRAPKSNPRAVAQEIEERIVAARAAHPSWGPRKLLAWLRRKEPELAWPATSTIGLILDRHGLVVHRRPRSRATPSAHLRPADCANAVWGMDFKGWFRTGDGQRCDPFSLSDLGSRYVLRLQAVERADAAHVWPVMDAAFREFGLPEAMRSDNGAPFASTGAGGLSALSVKLIKAGVLPERIQPGKPQQNGRHERLHRTVQQETASPPAATVAAQQQRFDTFRRAFNEERPHEALDQATPAERFTPSGRSYSGRLREPEYDGVDHVRRVRRKGEIKWAGERVFISEALIGEPVGMIETEDGALELIYGPVLLGHLDREGRFRKAKTNLTPTPAE